MKTILDLYHNGNFHLNFLPSMMDMIVNGGGIPCNDLWRKIWAQFPRAAEPETFYFEAVTGGELLCTDGVEQTFWIRFLLKSPLPLLRWKLKCSFPRANNL